MHTKMSTYGILIMLVLLLTACNNQGSTSEVIETSQSQEIPGEEETNSTEVEEPIQLLIEEDIPSLYKQYEDYFTVGVAVPMKFMGDENMSALIKKHFNSMTAENSMKPEGMINAGDPTRIQTVMSDMYSNYTIENNIGLRGHTFVWHQATPDWYYREDFSRSGAVVSKEVMYERLENHIMLICERYNDTNLYAWDVCNEVIDPSTETMYRDSLWYKICGTEYIEKAFEFARKYTEGTDIKLYYNDYNVVSDETKRMAIYEMVKELKEKDLIDGIGLQSHINISGPSASEFEETIELFETLDLEVSITEMDISVFTDSKDTIDGPDDFEQRMILQANLYKDVFDVCVEHSDTVANITFWSLKDDQSWLNAYFGRSKNWPVLFDKDYQAKYAFWGLVDPSKVPELE